VRVAAPLGSSGSFRQIRPIDYQALRLLNQRSIGGSQLKKETELRKLDKAFREGRLGYPTETPPDWKWRMCEARMMLGDFSDWSGWEYRSEWSTGMWHNSKEWRHFGSDLWVKQTPAWDGRFVEHLHVHGEQGVGDEVWAAQVLKRVAKHAGTVFLETDKRLCSIFERSLPVKCIPSHQDIENGERVRYFRSTSLPWIPLGDLLRNFYRQKQDFERTPYLTALPLEVEKWKPYKGRVGISWRGAQGSYPLTDFLKMYPTAIGLQYDLAWDEEVERPELDLRNDLEGILGLLSNLDRLVTVSTSVAHFAAALGTKVDLILAPMNGIRQNMLPFKWGGGGKSFWYPDTVTVYPTLRAYLSR
jgi:hypothetical protein